jgi:hypothetical protein
MAGVYVGHVGQGIATESSVGVHEQVACRRNEAGSAAAGLAAAHW